MPRYVILEHDHPELHWDLMLEAGDTLRTWRLSSPPEVGAPVTATPSFDHRLVYLDYEGPVSGNRGQVKQWDSGNYADISAAGEFRIQVQGRALHGTITFYLGSLLYLASRVA